MCAPAGQTQRPEHFSPRVKCCSFHPDLPNFLVGQILLEKDSSSVRARSVIEQRIRDGHAVTPLGIHQPARYSLLYDNAPGSFGRSMSMRCPYFIDEEGGRCGIWKYRNAVCATYFCKHERGATGYNFWNVLKQMLSSAEIDLAVWCAFELKLASRSLEKLVAYGGSRDRTRLNESDLDERADPAERSVNWGNWAGREEEFFRKCAELVAPLKWREVVSLCGPKTRVLANLAQEAHVRLKSTELPQGLIPAGFHLFGVRQDRAMISTYSSNDPIEVPVTLIQLLRYFDGRPTGEVLTDIETSENVIIHEPLVRKLNDFRVLVERPQDREVVARSPDEGV